MLRALIKKPLHAEMRVQVVEIFGKTWRSFCDAVEKYAPESSDDLVAVISFDYGALFGHLATQTLSYRSLKRLLPWEAVLAAVFKRVARQVGNHVPRLLNDGRFDDVVRLIGCLEKTERVIYAFPLKEDDHLEAAKYNNEARRWIEARWPVTFY